MRSYTIGVVGNSVATDRSGEVNIQDSKVLIGGEDRDGEGTTAPELVRVTVDETLEQARFVFDERELSDGTAGASAFGYYTSNGEVVQAQSVVSVDDDVVVVEFGDGGAAQVDEAARFFVRSDAMQGQQDVGNTISAVGGRTAAPDLVAVSPADGNAGQFDFRFDEPVENEDASQFFLYTNDAQRLTGSSVTIPDPQTVRVTFPEAMDFIDSITRAAVAEGAVASLDPADTGNTIGAADISAGAADVGPTSGPDLVDVTLNDETGEAIFTFDATLEEESPSAGAFFLITDSGSVESAREVVNVTGGEVTGNMVVVLFDEPSTQAAELASVDMGAVTGQQDNENPVRTVDVG